MRRPAHADQLLADIYEAVRASWSLPDAAVAEYFVFENGLVKPATRDQWGQWIYDDHADRRIDYTLLDDGTEVSTVFLGINLSATCVPRLFETMIFGGEYDQSGYRALTPDEARHTHAIVVSALRSGVSPSLVDSERLWIGSFLRMLGFTPFEPYNSARDAD